MATVVLTKVTVAQAPRTEIYVEFADGLGQTWIAIAPAVDRPCGVYTDGKLAVLVEGRCISS